MGPLPDDLPLIQDQDLVCLHDGGDPLGHDHDRHVLRLLGQGTSEPGIRRIVQG